MFSQFCLDVQKLDLFKKKKKINTLTPILRFGLFFNVVLYNINLLSFLKYKIIFTLYFCLYLHVYKKYIYCISQASQNFNTFLQFKF